MPLTNPPFSTRRDLRREPLQSRTRSGHIPSIILLHSTYSHLCPAQSPPPYSSLPQGSSVQSSSSLSSLLPPDLAPTNYIHIKEKDHSVKRQILLDLSVPRPPASALPDGVPPGEDTPHLLLDSHNGSVSGEVWVLRTNPKDTTAHKPPPARERVNLLFRSRNGSIKALVVRVRRLGNVIRAPSPYESFCLFGSISIRRW